MCERGFKTLRKQHCWPIEKPKVEPNKHGWVNKEKQGLISFQIRHNPLYILELGAWLGESTRFFLDNYCDAKMVTIDHWEGSAEHRNPKRRDYQKLGPVLDILYETFCVNCWDYRERLVPIKASTKEGMKIVLKSEFVPDVIFVDAGHNRHEVLEDLEACYKITKNAVIVGDDWRWIHSPSHLPTVRLGVEDFLKRHKEFILTVVGNSSWSLRTRKHFNI